jgi:transposase
LRAWLRLLPENALVLFEDETDLMLFPPLWAGWSKKGTTQQVLVSGNNERLVMFGALNAKTGHLLLLPQERQRALEFQNFLDLIREHYRKNPLVLILDEDSCHKALESQECAKDQDIQLWWLPVRSPELNPLERLWEAAKKDVCANYQYEDLDKEAAHFAEYLLELSPLETLNLSGIMSEDFWLLRET